MSKRKPPHRLVIQLPRCKGCGAVLPPAYDRDRKDDRTVLYIKCANCGDNTVADQFGNSLEVFTRKAVTE